MGWTATLSILCVGLLVFLWANWQARKPIELGRVRMVPYTPIMFIALLVVLLMVAHVMTLLGLKPETGSFPPRMGNFSGHIHFT